eukprot:1137554-Pelagomonas_calceolata.AAC.13
MGKYQCLPSALLCNGGQPPGGRQVSWLRRFLISLIGWILVSEALDPCPMCKMLYLTAALLPQLPLAAELTQEPAALACSLQTLPTQACLEVQTVNGLEVQTMNEPAHPGRPRGQDHEWTYPPRRA